MDEEIPAHQVDEVVKKLKIDQKLIPDLENS